MGTELQSGQLPKIIRATIGTPCLPPQTVGKRTEFLFCNLRIHVQPRKSIYRESSTLASGIQKHPWPGNSGIVLVKSKTSSLSAWLDKEQLFTSVGTKHVE
jgi:hypothetical protein